MANKARGAFTFKFLDKEYTTICSFDFISEVEEKTDKGILDLCLNAGSLKIKEISSIMHAGLRHSDSKTIPNLEKVQKEAAKQGYTKMIVPVRELLRMSLSGDDYYNEGLEKKSVEAVKDLAKTS